MKKMILSLCLCVPSVVCAGAQDIKTTTRQGDPGKAVQALVDRFDREFTNVARQMPSEQFDFSPASVTVQGANFMKVRSFSDQVKHVALANFSIAATITGTEPAANGDVIGKLKTKDEILAALANSFAAVRRAIMTITPANANDVVDDPGIGPDQTRATEAAWVAVHGYDHYGQIVEYLRLKGIVPKP